MSRDTVTAAPQTAAAEPLVRIEDLTKHFPIQRGIILKRTVGTVQAVDGVSLSVGRGETVALVGESGCGKSTTGRLILRLLAPTRGRILYEGTDIAGVDRETMRRMRRHLQIIFQDPFASLNPRMTVGDILAEPLDVHGLARGRDRTDRVRELLTVVGLAPEHARRYPHQFSGGQRQRIGIARALAVDPAFIVCDEPVSALDVSIQAQVVNLLQDLQEKFGLSYLFIAHDLAVVRHIADRVAVMYLGKLVETADKRALFARPLHPYTQALLAAIPKPDPRAGGVRAILTGDVPSPLNPPPGCRFHTRCPHARARCREEEPPLRDAVPGHQVACHFFEEIPYAADPAALGGASAKLARRLRLFDAAKARQGMEAVVATGG
ncbi:MAG: ABC transporter ATP-binding protein [Alphaproteobacteria bacterium]